jgi:hypothetical protein
MNALPPEPQFKQPINQESFKQQSAGPVLGKTKPIALISVCKTP